MSKKESNIRILCPLTKWVTTVATRGRGTGNKITSRLVVAGDPRCWFIAIERKGGQSAGMKFYKGFCHLIPRAVEEYKLNPNHIISVICKELGIEPIFEGTLKEIGTYIDEQAKTNFNKIEHEDVYERHLKGRPKFNEA